jgi:hypothetical protein
MDAAAYARQADPWLNPQFQRGWLVPPSPKRKRHPMRQHRMPPIENTNTANNTLGDAARKAAEALFAKRPGDRT